MNQNLYRVSKRVEVSEIRSRICRHIARCLVRMKRPLTIDEIADLAKRDLPTENRVPARTVIAWHVRHFPYFVRAGKVSHAELPPKKQPTRITRSRAA